MGKHKKVVDGIPFDIAIIGYNTNTVNFLRLWESKASEEFDLDVLNQGGYVEAVRKSDGGNHFQSSLSK